MRLTRRLPLRLPTRAGVGDGLEWARLVAQATPAFIDPAGYKAYIAEREKTFRDEWERQKKNPGSPKQ